MFFGLVMKYNGNHNNNSDNGSGSNWHDNDDFNDCENK